MHKIYHINFHTYNSVPLFQYEKYENFIKKEINEIIADKGIPCIKWNTAITHLHFLIIAFPDMPRCKIVQYIKGVSSIRSELIGGHLWQKGYDWVEVKTIDHFNEAVKYI